MKTSVIALGLLAGLALTPATAEEPADAQALAPLQAGIFAVENHIASVHYTVSGDDFDVVTTIAPDAEHGGVPMQFVAPLAPGEKQTVSIGAFDTTASPRLLELVHDGDRLVATLMPGKMAAR